MNSNVPHLRSLVSVSYIEIIVQVKIVEFCLQFDQTNRHDGSVVSVVRTERLQTPLLVHLNSCSCNGEFVQLQSALNDD